MAEVNLRILLSAIDKATPALVQVQDSLKAGKVAAEEFGRKWAESLDMAKRAGQAMMVAGGAIVAAFAGMGVESAKFQQNMRNVNSIVKGGEAGFAAMSEQVKQLAWDPKITASATELAAGLYDIQSSGIAASESMKVLEIASKGAAAGQSDAATASRVLTATMNAYNAKTGKDAERIMDILFKTVDRGVVTFDELAGSLSNATSVAANAGVPLEEVAAALATMTKMGFSAAEGNTAIGRAITTLMNPSKELAAKLKETGYSSGYALLQQKGLAGAMKWLTEATGNQVDKMVELMGEMRAARAGMSLAGAGAEMFAEDLLGMADAAGSMGVALDEQLRCPMAKWKLFVKEMKLLALEFGSVFIDVVKPLAPILHSAALAVKAVIDNPVGKWAAAATLAFGAFLLVAGFGIVQLAKLAGSFVALKTAMEAFSGTATAMKLAGGLWTAAEGIAAVFGNISAIASGAAAVIGSVLAPIGAALAGIGAAIAAIPIGTILAIVAAVAAVGIGLYELVTNWPAVSRWFGSLGRGIVSGLSAAWDAIISFFADLPSNLGRWLGSAARAVAYGLGWIVGFFQRLPSRVGEIARELPGQIRTGLSQALTAIRDWARDSWDRFVDWGRRLPGVFKAAMVGLYTAISDGLQRALRAIGDFFVRIYDWLRALPGRVWQYAKDAARSFSEAFKAALGSGAFGAGKAAGQEAAGGIAGKRAGGGSVSGGKAYLVGERGPEVFIPATGGQILNDISSALAGIRSPVGGMETPYRTMRDAFRDAMGWHGNVDYGRTVEIAAKRTERNTSSQDGNTRAIGKLTGVFGAITQPVRGLTDAVSNMMQSMASMTGTIRDSTAESISAAVALENDRRTWQTQRDAQMAARPGTAAIGQQATPTAAMPGATGGGFTLPELKAVMEWVKANGPPRPSPRIAPIRTAPAWDNPAAPTRILRDALLQMSVAGPLSAGAGANVNLTLQPGLTARIETRAAGRAVRVRQDTAQKTIDAKY